LIELAFVLKRIESTDDAARVSFDEVLRTEFPGDGRNEGARICRRQGPARCVVIPYLRRLDP
jgi:hypothetical protein